MQGCQVKKMKNIWIMKAKFTKETCLGDKKKNFKKIFKLSFKNRMGYFAVFLTLWLFRPFQLFFHCFSYTCFVKFLNIHFGCKIFNNHYFILPLIFWIKIVAIICLFYKCLFIKKEIFSFCNPVLATPSQWPTPLSPHEETTISWPIAVVFNSASPPLC